MVVTGFFAQCLRDSRYKHCRRIDIMYLRSLECRHSQRVLRGQQFYSFKGPSSNPFLSFYPLLCYSQRIQVYPIGSSFSRLQVLDTIYVCVIIIRYEIIWYRGPVRICLKLGGYFVGVSVLRLWNVAGCDYCSIQISGLSLVTFLFRDCIGQSCLWNVICNYTGLFCTLHAEEITLPIPFSR